MPPGTRIRIARVDRHNSLRRPAEIHCQQRYRALGSSAAPVFGRTVAARVEDDDVQPRNSTGLGRFGIDLSFAARSRSDSHVRRPFTAEPLKRAFNRALVKIELGAIT
jgi:hypothetical protein